MADLTLGEVAATRLPVGVECNACIRRSVLSPDRLKALPGSRRRVRDLPLRCTGCGSRKFTVTRFRSESQARAFLLKH